jgi:hypothetical protein
MSAVTFIKPKPSFASKVGRLPTFDPNALERAEAALDSLSDQFDDWMKVEADKLAAARDAAKDAAWSDAALIDIFTRAHDIKGLGATYKFPIASQLANSLCQTLESPRNDLDRATFVRLISAHVDAMRAFVRDGVRDDTHPVARALLTELSEQSRALLAAS